MHILIFLLLLVVCLCVSIIHCAQIFPLRHKSSLQLPPQNVNFNVNCKSSIHQTTIHNIEYGYWDWNDFFCLGAPQIFYTWLKLHLHEHFLTTSNKYTHAPCNTVQYNTLKTLIYSHFHIFHFISRSSRFFVVSDVVWDLKAHYHD